MAKKIFGYEKETWYLSLAIIFGMILLFMGLQLLVWGEIRWHD